MKTLYVFGLVISVAFVAQVAFAESTTTVETRVEVSATSQSSTEGDRACTTEYAPVCGELEGRQTFSNRCELDVRGAKFVHEGECKEDSSAGGSTEGEVEEGGEDVDASGSASSQSNIGSSGEDGTTVEREMKESGEKGGTEDINIGVGELQETGTIVGHEEWIVIESVFGARVEVNKGEFIDSIIDSSNGGLRSGYLKIGDIKGEATESAKKPKEIVVVGSKVREEDVPFVIQWGGTGSSASADSFFDIWIDAGEDRNAAPDSFFDIFPDIGEGRSAMADSFFDIFVDVTDADLHLQAVSIAQTNTEVEEVEVLESEVRVSHREQMRLFGFIPVNGTRTITVDTTDPERDGKVKIRFPWWSFLASKTTDTASLETQIETELDATIPVADTDDRPTEEVAFYYNKIQAQTLKVISSISLSVGN